MCMCIDETGKNQHAVGMNQIHPVTYAFGIDVRCYPDDLGSADQDISPSFPFCVYQETVLNQNTAHVLMILQESRGDKIFSMILNGKVLLVPDEHINEHFIVI